MRKTTNFAENSVVLVVETPIYFAASKFCWISNLLNFTRLRSVYLEYQLKCCVHAKDCVKIFIYCWVHKVYSDNRLKFMLHRLSFIPVCRLKLTATTYKSFKVFITRGHFTGVTSIGTILLNLWMTKHLKHFYKSHLLKLLIIINAKMSWKTF